MCRADETCCLQHSINYESDLFSVAQAKKRDNISSQRDEMKSRITRTPHHSVYSNVPMV